MEFIIALSFFFASLTAVVAPSHMSVELPSGPKEVEKSALAQVFVASSGELFLMGKAVSRDELLEQLGTLDRDGRIIVSASNTTQYADVIEVMGAIKALGFNDIALVTRTQE